MLSTKRLKPLIHKALKGVVDKKWQKKVVKSSSFYFFTFFCGEGIERLVFFLFFCHEPLETLMYQGFPAVAFFATFLPQNAENP